MNEQTIVAVYDTAARADAAVRDLEVAGVPAKAISHYSKNGPVTATGGIEVVESERRRTFWSRLFGLEPAYDTKVYDRSIDNGATVVSVRMPAEDSDRISNLLEKHSPTDLDGDSGRYAAPRARDAAGASDRETMRLREETLSVGKRAVSGGTTRVRRYVVETPVEKSVNLQSERVTVERRPVTGEQPAHTPDFADNDKTIEMTETHEEPVVSKAARVKEEVSLRKEATERVETVKDTVRREDAKIEKVAGSRGKVPGGHASTDPELPTSPIPRRP